MNLNVQVTSGDIASVKADALITAINSGGFWFGGIDGVIMNTAGNMFHNQAALALKEGLEDGQAIAVHAELQHDGEFGDVIFVIDDLQQPLRNIVKAGLEAADHAGYETVTIPTIRMGVMKNQVESPDKAIKEMVIGILTFEANGWYNHLKEITIVVYNDPSTEALLREELGI
ncbi:MAG: hypothetical protein Q7S53_01715 [bacterium]|nr:hypothetical protein [bacterium]